MYGQPQPQPPPQQSPARGAAPTVGLGEGMSPPTRVRWKRESSLSTVVEEHPGQATVVVPEADTSSSNWWSQSVQTYS